MRNSVAKKLKTEVAFKMYVGDGVTWDDIKKDKHSVYDSPDFKPVYRGRKKNYMRTTTAPRHMAVNLEFDEANHRMFLHRKAKEERHKRFKKW